MKEKPSLSRLMVMLLLFFYDQEEGYDLVRVIVASCSQTDNKWVLDSGCTYHICTNKHLFSQSYNER